MLQAVLHSPYFHVLGLLCIVLRIFVFGPSSNLVIVCLVYRGLPPMYWDGFSMHDVPNSPDPVQNDGIFFLPPIRYPDGR
jgi:hypothetical protein